MNLIRHLTISLSLLSTASFSQAAFESGAYLGAALGYSHTRTKTHETVKATPAITHDNDQSQSTHANAPSGSLFIGYLFEPCNDSAWRIAPELFCQYTTNSPSTKFGISAEGDEEDTHIAGTIKDDLSFPWMAGGKLRLGYVCGPDADWMPYAYIGASFSPMEWKRYENGSITAAQKKTVAAILAGVGLEKELKNHHRIGLELGYTGYASSTFCAKDSHDDSHCYKARPQIWSISLRYSIPF